MEARSHWLPTAIVLGAAVAMLAYGPIAQLEGYHDFADARTLWGVANAQNVLSNVPFALVGAWGLALLAPRRRLLARSFPGHALFAAALLATAFGSAWYHLAPDNARLVWDRLPIALACAGLLAGLHAETHVRSPGWITPALAAFAVASVFWWSHTEARGAGDLRPYLLLQGMPLVVVPLWQWLARARRGDRVAFGVAIALYALAKAAELADRPILDALGGSTSGHALKHLLAAAAGAVLVWRMARFGPLGARG